MGFPVGVPERVKNVKILTKMGLFDLHLCHIEYPFLWNSASKAIGVADFAQVRVGDSTAGVYISGCNAFLP